MAEQQLEWLLSLIHISGGDHRSDFGGKRCACHYAYRSRKIIMLSGSGIDDAGNYDRDLPFDLFDDGSGEGVEWSRDSCRIYQQLSDRKPGCKGFGICKSGTIQNRLCGAGASGDSKVSRLCLSCRNLYGDDWRGTLYFLSLIHIFKFFSKYSWTKSAISFFPIRRI